VQAGEGAATEEDAANGAERLVIGDADEMAGNGSFDGHLGNDGYAHARANHTDKAAELAAFERDLRMDAGAVAGSDGSVAEAMAVTEEEKWLGTEILEQDRRALGKTMILRNNRKKALGEE